MTDVNFRADSANPPADLKALRVAELQVLATQLGIHGANKLRKGELVEAINETQTSTRQKPAAGTAESESPAAALDTSVASTPVRGSSGVRRSSSRRATTADAERALAHETAPEPDLGATKGASESDDSQPSPAIDVPVVLPTASEASQERTSEQRSNRGGQRRARSGEAPRTDANAETEKGDSPETADGASQSDSSEQRQSRNRNRGERQQNNKQANQRGGQQQDRQQGGRQRGGQQADRQQTAQQQGDRQSQGDQAHGDERQGGERNGRNRSRDRKRRGGAGDDFEPEITEDDVLIPVAGILDVLDNYAFVRTSGYLSGSSDVYVSLGQVKKYHLRKGDAVVGSIRQPRGNENNSRQKYNAIVKVDSINGQTIEEAAARVEFQKLTPLYPDDRLRLETESSKLTQRIVDLVSPIGKGQRGLIVAPPKAGKTIVMQQIANAISANNPEVHLMVVLVDERPEEVTDMQRTVKGEVIASTFDRPAEDHTTVAELAIERAKRLVELGHDVVVLLDSITRLGRAYNLVAPASGRVLSGGVDASALYPPKRFFGAARNIENGGSLTIIASALVETGSKMDEVIFEEFKGTGNMELRLSRQLADKRIFPAVDVSASGTRREELLMGADEVKTTWQLRRALSGLDQQQALEMVLGRLKETSNNVEFLRHVQKSVPAANGAGQASHANGHYSEV